MSSVILHFQYSYEITLRNVNVTYGSTSQLVPARQSAAEGTQYVFEMLLQRYCWETLNWPYTFDDLLAYVLTFLSFVLLYLVSFGLLEFNNGERDTPLVHASERAPPQVTRSSRVKITYLHFITMYLIRTGEGRAHNITNVIRSFSQY